MLLPADLISIRSRPESALDTAGPTLQNDFYNVYFTTL